MCGIAGYFGKVGPAAPARVRQMLAAQRHRGPDGAGIAVARAGGGGWINAVAAAPSLLNADPVPTGCALGHNLLAIQDRTAAAYQPMVRGNLALVFNGEIYNFVELRRSLEAAGVRFESAGDTEVLPHLWRIHGAGTLAKLRGMFAFAIADGATGTLWAARDPFGIKPFYYALNDAGDLCFASEIRALHACGWVRREMDRDCALACAAAGINAFGDGRTLYRGIYELPPGHWLRARDGHFAVEPFYELPKPSSTLTGPAATAELREACRHSVELHLRSRRRIATCLSGGLDSSAIATLVGRELGSSSGDFQTFTICTSGPADSEVAAAADVCRAAGLGHVTVEPKQISRADVLGMVVACETPNQVIGPINQYLLLSEVAVRGVTVVLDGQGGDELLSGYPWFIPVLLDAAERQGRSTEALRAALSARLPYPPQTMETFTRMFYSPREWVKAYLWQGSFLGWSVEQILELAPTQYYLADSDDWETFRRREYFRAELRYLLRQEDRIGMWFGLECRVPFVDAPLVEVASRIDPFWLLHDGYLKFPFRDMLPELPERVRWNTTKRGFWETDRNQFDWVRQWGRGLVLGSDFLRRLFPPIESEWDTLSFDQHWRLLQLAVLERCAVREDLDTLS